MVKSSHAKRIHFQQGIDGNRVIRETIIVPDGKYIVNSPHSSIDYKISSASANEVIFPDEKYTCIAGLSLTFAFLAFCSAFL